MTTTFELHERELDATFLRSVKALFRNQRLRVVIEAGEEENEDWLTPDLKEKLHRSLEEVGKGETVQFNAEKWDADANRVLENRV